MLSKQERQYMMFPKEFKEMYDEKYCKKIRNIIRKKMMQSIVDMYYVVSFDDNFIPIEKNKKLQRKSLTPMVFNALSDLIDYHESYPTNEKSLQSFLSIMRHSLSHENTGKIIINKKLEDDMNSASKKSQSSNFIGMK